MKKRRLRSKKQELLEVFLLEAEIERLRFIWTEILARFLVLPIKALSLSLSIFKMIIL